MAWWGKVAGGAFGFMFGGPLGALFGAALGHQFDKGLSLDHGALGSSEQENVQAAFFTATFSVMGHLAKADGQVTAKEIELANQVMAQMALSAEQKKAAQNLFNEGKGRDFAFTEIVEQFRRICGRRTNLKRMFMEIQFHAAYADGHLHDAERQLLQTLNQMLGFDARYFEQLESMTHAQYDFHRRETQRPSAKSRARQLEDAYQMLGVSSSASDAEVKKAYRRLMNQHHPDKLVAKGLPEEMMELATERTQEIKAAYELIRSQRSA